MIIDISDPEVSSAYRQVLNTESKDWLILAYSKARDALRLVDSGAGGPDALRNHMGPHSGDVLFVLVQAAGKNSLVLVSYIPPAVGGVKRARAIVHCRAVEDVFPARRAVLSVSSEAEITPAALERVLHSASSPQRKPVISMGLQRPMSPPQSSEDGRSNHPLPRLPSLTSAQPQERGLPLNLPEPLDPERHRELVDQQRHTQASGMLAPTDDGRGHAARSPSPKPGKPQLSVAVPPRGERGLRPMEYDGAGGSYEFDADEDDNDEDAEEEEEEEDNDSPAQDSLVLRHHSRPSSRGPTPPPGPSILRHPSPIPPRPDHGGSTNSTPSSSHIRFTGPPKDHPHPDHHPLKPTDQIVAGPAARSASNQMGQLSHGTPGMTSVALGGPNLGSAMFQRTASTSSRPVEASVVPPPAGLPQPSVVAPSLLHSAVTWQSASQPGHSSNALNSPQPSQVPRSNADSMAPPKLTNPPPGASTPPAHRQLPSQPPNTFSALSLTNPSAPGAAVFAAHSRNTSVSTAPGQTHVPSGTLSAFGRRPSVSSVQQNGGNPNIPPIGQLNHAGPSSLVDRSSGTTAVTSSTTSTSYRPTSTQAPGMTEAQAQVARSRAKWAAEEQGISVPPPSVPATSLPRSPPLTPPTSPPRSLSADEAGRVRRDGVERMRREAERRREEDEKKRVAEERRRIEMEQQQKLDKEREAREEREVAEREEKRKDMEVRRRALEEEQGKQRAEEKVRAKERFAEVKGTDEVFLTGQLNIQAENTMTWRRRFYELTAGGCLSLYKSSDAPDRIKPLDTIHLKDAKTIDHSADELELIPYAFKVEFGGGKESWSFYTDSQHDMDILTEGMTWTMT